MATATSVGTTRTIADDGDAMARAIAWIKAHRQLSLWAVAILVVAGGLMWWNALSTRQSQENASRALLSARLAFESRNYPLAASELSRIAENYSGTHAAQESNLLLAQVRLAQGQSQSAIELLRRFAAGAGKDFRAQAYGLLGAAYENAAHPREAADAYQQAADASLMAYLKVQYLSDAGRAWTNAGDTAKAIAAYNAIVAAHDSIGSAVEAKVRLGELTHGSTAK
jgi:tetratricopeptide (TPR) repeat protein